MRTLDSFIRLLSFGLLLSSPVLSSRILSSASLPSPLLPSTLGFLLAVAPLAAAFEAEEHKLVGDLGSEWVLKLPKVAALFQASNSAPAMTTYVKPAPQDANIVDGDLIRLVRHELLPALRQRKDRKWGNPFFPREANIEAERPLAIWVGTSDKDSQYGSWFTFGDLVAIYGDLRRIVTCGTNDLEACTFTDNPRKFTAARRQALRDLTQGWQFFAGADKYLAALTPSMLDNTDVADGKETSRGWALEVIKLAMTNHWHFGKVALKWYTSMHRQAFVLMYNAALYHRKAKASSGQVAITYAEKSQKFFWSALHYEAHGLHSLTDLFAPGHTLTDRWDTSFGILLDNLQLDHPFPKWQESIWGESYHPDSMRGVQSRLRGVRRPPSNELDTSVTDTARLAVRSKAEQKLHEAFNAGGAVVRNLKCGTASKWVFPHPELKQSTNGWVAFGDGDMSYYGPNARNTLRANPWHTEWVAAAVSDSLATLLGAFADLRQLSSESAITKAAIVVLDSGEFYEALADIPIKVHNLCFDKSHCFVPDAADGAQHWAWMPYAAIVFDALKQTPPSDMDIGLPICTGTGTSDLDGECERNFDGPTPRTERDLANARVASPLRFEEAELENITPSKASELLTRYLEAELADAGAVHPTRWSEGEDENYLLNDQS